MTDRRPVPDRAPGASIPCPECGTLSVVTLSRREADDFCRACDYPMFWARPEQSAGPAGEAGDAARRRLPGALGSSPLATVACPACSELNLPGAWLCVRCDASMVPEEPPAAVPPPAPEPIVVLPEPREPEPSEPFPYWWLLAMLVVGAAAWWASTLLP